MPNRNSLIRGLSSFGDLEALALIAGFEPVDPLNDALSSIHKRDVPRLSQLSNDDLVGQTVREVLSRASAEQDILPISTARFFSEISTSDLPLPDEASDRYIRSLARYFLSVNVHQVYWHPEKNETLIQYSSAGRHDRYLLVKNLPLEEVVQRSLRGYKHFKRFDQFATKQTMLDRVPLEVAISAPLLMYMGLMYYYESNLQNSDNAALSILIGSIGTGLLLLSAAGYFMLLNLKEGLLEMSAKKRLYRAAIKSNSPDNEVQEVARDSFEDAYDVAVSGVEDFMSRCSKGKIYLSDRRKESRHILQKIRSLYKHPAIIIEADLRKRVELLQVKLAESYHD